MAVTNPWTITYGGREVGGDNSTYQLHGPYVLDKSYDQLRIGFDVVVVATSYETLQSLSDALETDFRKRDQDLEIDIDGNSWSYTSGSDALNVRASITKSGNPETDRGYSRAYTCVIEAELPADQDSGLRDLEVLVDYAASRRKTVTMRGTYTALSGQGAVEQYQSDFDSEATGLLDNIDSQATFELVDETYSIDRHQVGADDISHVCNFTRQYEELLSRQGDDLDEADIRDHRIVFTDLSQHPGDSSQEIRRLRRAVGQFDCAVDIDETTDLQQVYNTKVRPRMLAYVEATFTPRVFAIEGSRLSFDETQKRLSVEFTFVYVPPDSGGNIVEVSYSVAFRETRHVDYTPVHEKDELAAEADPGWAVVERIWSSTAVTLGEASPKLRVARSSPRAAGWNLIANHSSVTPHWVGDPILGQDQIRMSIVNETVVERFHRRPGQNTSTAIPTDPTPGPITGSGGSNNGNTNQGGSGGSGQGGTARAGGGSSKQLGPAAGDMG